MKINFKAASLFIGLQCLTAMAELVEDSTFVNVEALKAKKVSKGDLKTYENDSDDEEVYTETTEVVTVESTYDKFYDKVKHSIAKVSNGTSTFYGAVIKDKSGIYVITDKNSVNKGNITIKMLEGEEALSFSVVNVADGLIRFTLQAPYPKSLKPVVQMSQKIKPDKTISLAAISFDYGSAPEMTIGKGKSKNNTCEITSQLRRCRPGSPLFSSKGQLFGVIGWKASGNVGLTINSQKEWIPVKYPFPKPKRKKRRKVYDYDS